MKFRKSTLFMALAALLPALAHGQSAYGPSDAAYFNHEPFRGGPQIYQPADVYADLLPERRRNSSDYDSSRLTLGEALSGSYVRFDYLNWNISGGDGALLGAPISSTADLSGDTPGQRLPAYDPVTGFVPEFSVVVPSLENRFDNVNGLRGTLGIPTNGGTLEGEIFYFEQVDNRIGLKPTLRNDGVLPTTLIGGTTLLTNGLPGTQNMILFNQDYLARQETSFFGSELNWIFNPFVPNTRTQVSPILGFRHLHLDDHLNISGTHVQDQTVTLNHVIGSMARNNVFGPQMGLKFQTQMGSRLELGVETKFLAGINRMSEGVHTSEIYNTQFSIDPDATTEADRSLKETRTRFAPVFDLALTGKYQLTPNFKLFASYELLLGSGFSRAFNNVNYDSPTSVNSAPEIGLRPKNTEFMAHGFAVGGEFSFR